MQLHTALHPTIPPHLPRPQHSSTNGRSWSVATLPRDVTMPSDTPAAPQAAAWITSCRITCTCSSPRRSRASHRAWISRSGRFCSKAQAGPGCAPAQPQLGWARCALMRAGCGTPAAAGGMLSMGQQGACGTPATPPLTRPCASGPSPQSQSKSTPGPGPSALGGVQPAHPATMCHPGPTSSSLSEYRKSPPRGRMSTCTLQPVSRRHTTFSSPAGGGVRAKARHALMRAGPTSAGPLQFGTGAGGYWVVASSAVGGGGLGTCRAARGIGQYVFIRGKPPPAPHRGWV